MNRMTTRSCLRVSACALMILFAASLSLAQIKPARNPNQPIDEDYTKKIREYTTAPYFNSPLTDYLPASPGVPTPKAVLGDVAGAPGARASPAPGRAGLSRAGRRGPRDGGPRRRPPGDRGAAGEDQRGRGVAR